ncbi:LysR family transcriptional regulator [Sneathiella chinensis]|uniref:LysR family transcriptional regulator n=2 Tax=Sneathiella chinensis TaxID=349750 RepID=A0ABQ5TZQ7_9PROT|nr:LysR family transcriptional regulator [Sneathiella chinensis]GLQ05048.1 LysR family transcriptional regulator [Sneathiella chinensis]
MTLEQLRTFLWVARLGGVRRAAEQMNISQPAVSSRIASLEEYLGTKLFARGATGVTLTKKGVLLRNHADQIAGLVERIKADVMAADSVSRLLRLGVAETVAQTWLPDFLTRLHQIYPKLKIEVSVDISLHLREQLLDRSLDLAILMGPVSEFTVDNIDMPPFKLDWYRPLDMEQPDLTKTPVITYNRNSRPHRELTRELQARYGSTAQIFPTNSLSTGVEMVAAGIGVGILPAALGQKMVQEKRIATFNPGWLPRPLHFTASYIGDPRDEQIAQAALIAREIGTEHARRLSEISPD